MAVVDQMGQQDESHKLESKHELLSQKKRTALSSKMTLDIIRGIDLLIIFFTAIIAKYIYLDLYLQAYGAAYAYQETYSYKFMLPAFLAAAFTYIIFRRGRLYREFVFGGFNIEPAKVAYYITSAFSIVLFLGFIFKVTEDYSRGWFSLWVSLAIFFILLERLIIRYTLQSCISQGLFNRKIAIIASDHQIGMQLKSSLMETNKGIEVVGFFDDKIIEQTDEWQTLQQLIEIGQNSEVDQVVISMPTSEEQRIKTVYDRLRVLPVDVQLCPTSQSFQLPLLKVEKVGAVELLLLHRKPIEGWNYFLKTIEDYVIGFISLLVFAPAMLLIALAIKLDTKGPVFFRQRRHGYNHQLIEVFKFRTMTVMEDGDVIKQAQKDDNRVTRVGKFLRKTSLDELPQLINVLRGEMSIVGPRPHAMAHNHYYSELIETYANRHNVKPGITGWAQINGFRGPTNTPEEMKKRAELDLHYIDNWSLWMDIKIIALTPIYGFVGKNAF